MRDIRATVRIHVCCCTFRFGLLCFRSLSLLTFISQFPHPNYKPTARLLPSHLAVKRRPYFANALANFREENAGNATFQQVCPWKTSQQGNRLEQQPPWQWKKHRLLPKLCQNFSHKKKKHLRTRKKASRRLFIGTPTGPTH